MILPDVNVLVYAYRDESKDHADYKRWLEEHLASDEAFGLSDEVARGFLRVVTHSRIFSVPAPIGHALDFVEVLRLEDNVLRVVASDRHWPIFDALLRGANAKGNTVPDAYLAALAIEWGCELVTADRGFARFRGLRWRHPLEDAEPSPVR